ncbi:hypothetical protein J0S82_018796 [Galemys pyrenaicus]|uniref:Sushi domain-containing protein n=1 Tax=Galemys pyrenaicus TaxID=202257 RepID=A0A8J5Z8G4_GALPY|nr:hypothetical protein J0S82_018796 [Galemys pyrenaicus]
MQIKGTPKTSYTAGEQVEYQCRPGFRRKGVGTITVTCGADGTWTDPPEEPCISECQAAGGSPSPWLRPGGAAWGSLPAPLGVGLRW